MRRILAWLLVVLGVVVCLPSLVAALWVGTDDTASTGPHSMTTAGVAIMTEAEVLHYVGPVLHLTVERSDGGSVFLGVAQDVDAESYLFDHGSRVVTRVGLPWDVESGERVGALAAVAAPGDQPWWIVSVDGAGPQELVWSLPHGRYSIVALNSDGSAGVDADVTLGLEIPGTFYTLLAVAAAGLLLVLIGAWLLLRRRRRARTGDTGSSVADSSVDTSPAASPSVASPSVASPSERPSTDMLDDESRASLDRSDGVRRPAEFAPPASMGPRATEPSAAAEPQGSAAPDATTPEPKPGPR